MVDQPCQTIDFLDLAAEGLLRLAIAIAAQCQLDFSTQRGQRCAQLVRERGAELPHLGDRLLEPAERVVEGTGHFLEFVLHVASGQTPLERRHVDVLGGAGET